MPSASKNKPKSRDDVLFDIVLYTIASVLLLLVLYPLIFVLSASFSNPDQLALGEVWLWPKGFSLDAYTRILHNEAVWRGYTNTILYTVIGTLINIVLTLLAAYPLSRTDLPGKSFFMFMITFTMFFSGGMIPTYIVVKSLGLIDTFWAMIVPGAIATYNLIVMRTFFVTGIPNELQESAWMDGCSNTRLLLNIVLPLSKPILAVMTLFYSVGHWNAYFNALIYLKNSDLFPLQLILRQILVLNQSLDMGLESIGATERVLVGESIKYSIIVISCLPVLFMYPFVQRYFVKGVMIGSIKG